MKASFSTILFINLGFIIFIGNSVFAGVNINEIIKKEGLRISNLLKMDTEQRITRRTSIEDIHNEIIKNWSVPSPSSIQHLPQRPDASPDNQEEFDQHFPESCVNAEEILLGMISAQQSFEKILKEIEEVE